MRQFDQRWRFEQPTPGARFADHLIREHPAPQQPSLVSDHRPRIVQPQLVYNLSQEGGLIIFVGRRITEPRIPCRLGRAKGVDGFQYLYC